MVVTRVEDDGPGVQVDETVSGHGFGLSIASELSALHGGRIELEQSAVRGLIVKITLPAHIE